MSATAKPRSKRRRKRKAIDRTAIAPYVRELQSSRVPQSTVKTATAAMLILLGAQR
jgi:hypothetical protein